jgi:hypothetical protein
MMVMPCSLHSSAAAALATVATSSSRFTTSGLVLLTVSWYMKKARRKNAEDKISPRPTRQATASTWMGCTA